MSTLTKTTRSVKKLEVPRPLKCTTSAQHARSPVPEVKIVTDADLISLTEAVAVQLAQGSSSGLYDRMLGSNVAAMYSHLKLHGSQLEQQYKDFLDRYFVVFRNGSQDERLDRKTRLHLLELIELRAKHWHTSDYMSQYYRHRVTHEPLLVPTMDSAGGSGSVSPTLLPAEPAPVLAPGEVLKPSGKFPKPTKIPGKNYSKDEVVIRNADSGKVMGIKGRRVHMIEELSDTIISFQRVNPGAKERLVQITGPNEENVNHAKHLIGDTIRRNASPVRLQQAVEGLQGSNASLNSSGSDESLRPIINQKSPTSSARALHHSFSTNDAAIGEYKYTVTWGPHAIKITGNNLDVVKTAKLVLDEFFEREEALLEREGGEAGGDFFTLSSRAAMMSLGDEAVANGLPSSPTDDEVFAPPAPEENGGDVVFRRARFSRAASTDKKEGGVNASRHRYSYETLMRYSKSPLCRATPSDLASFPADLVSKVKAAPERHPALPQLRRIRPNIVTTAYSLPPRRILPTPYYPPAAYPVRHYIANNMCDYNYQYYY